MSGRLDDLQNWWDVLTLSDGRITGGDRKDNDALVNTSILAGTYTADVGVKEKHNGEDSLHITPFQNVNPS